jgi:purine-binding chemotaxis protein CheW
MNPTASERKSEYRQLVHFRAGGRDFVVDITAIREIIYFRPTTPLPTAPSFVEGVVDLRGSIIPVLDLRKRLRLAVSADSSPQHILIVKLNGQTVGLIVDHVENVVRIPAGDIQMPHKMIEGMDDRFLKGVCRVGEHLLFLLHLDGLLSDDERTALRVA